MGPELIQERGSGGYALFLILVLPNPEISSSWIYLQARDLLGQYTAMSRESNLNIHAPAILNTAPSSDSLPHPPIRFPFTCFRLKLHGSASGGDCDALRIQSTDSTYFNLRGHGGNLDILDTIVTSWDTDLAVPGVRDTADYSIATDDAEPRSYIRSVCCLESNSGLNFIPLPRRQDLRCAGREQRFPQALPETSLS